MTGSPTHRTLLRRDPTQVHDGIVTFTQVRDDEHPVRIRLHLLPDDHESIGRPDLVTVTVAPGDLLSEPDDAPPE